MSAFASTVATPPGGKWFWEDGEVLFESPSYHTVVDLIRGYFLKKGVTKDATVALAEYMCPRMPIGFCRGDFGPRRATVQELVKNTERYSGMPLETIDVVQRRLNICSHCPKCDHSLCVTCRGIDKFVYGMFQGRRMKLPEDRSSGVCTCTGAFTMAAASVCYDGPLGLGEAPVTCWRYEK